MAKARFVLLVALRRDHERRTPDSKGHQKTANELGWSVVWSNQNCNGKTEKYAEFYQESPAGEDFGFTCFYETLADLIDEIGKVSIDFDIEEHVTGLLEAKQNGLRGVPDIVTLVHDAEELDKMIEELWLTLDGIKRAIRG